jgi:beta-mannanase
MYPGDDVVDWIAWDPYASSQSAWLSGGYDRVMNRAGSNNAGWTGFYNWVTTKHAAKPLMLAEWGVYEYLPKPEFKPYLYRDVARQVAAYPKVKALVHFDSPAGVKGDTRIDTTPEALTAYRELVRSSYFRQDVTLLRTR